MVGPGAIGSWTCTTSNASSLSARIVLSAADGVGCQRGDRAVRRRGQAVAEGRHERFGRRAVARAEDARLVTLPAQLARQAEDLGLHAAG